MPAYFQLELDTTGPQNVEVVIDDGDSFSATQEVSVAVLTSDPNLDGYQVKLWGDVDPTANPSIQADEASSDWIALSSPHAVRLSPGDGVKTIYARLRDDVLNESASASDTIQLDTSVPVVSVISGPDRSVISKIPGSDVATFTWQADDDFAAYQVMVVGASSTPQSAGTPIPSTEGSQNMSGGAGAKNTPIVSSITGADLEAASPGDGEKVIKIFVQDTVTGEWSN